MTFNFLDYNGLLYFKQKIQTWVTNKFALKTEIPSSLPADGGNADTVNGHTVEANVPADAKFTDTVYTHPDSHPASMITEDASHRFVTDTEKTNYEAAYTHSTSAHASSDAEKNVIVKIQKNGEDVTVDGSRNVNIIVPTKTSDLTNDSNYQTQSDVQSAINSAIGEAIGLEFDILTTGEYDEETGKPTVAGAANKIYLVPKTSTEQANIYTEWIFVNNDFEEIGSTAVDLSNYVKNSDLVPLTNEQIDTIMSGT